MITLVFLFQGVDFDFRNPERTVHGFHEDPAREVQHRRSKSVTDREKNRPLPRRAHGVVGWPQECFVFVDEFHDLFLVPDVVARREHIHPALIDLLDDRPRDTEAAGGIFDIRHSQVDIVPVNDPGEKVSHGPSSRFSDDISDKKQLHFRGSLRVIRCPCFPDHRYLDLTGIG